MEQGGTEGRQHVADRLPEGVWSCNLVAVQGSNGVRARGYILAKARVVHYCAGGREQGGGIGRIVGYIQDEAERTGDRQIIVDTRGPRWSWIGSPWRLALSVGSLTWRRVMSPGCIHHVHVAGRGSTARKLILTAVARSLGCIHVLHLHDYDYEAEIDSRPNWIRQRIIRMFQGANLVVVLGQRDLSVIRRRLGVPAERIAVMPNCVPDPGPHAAGPGQEASGKPVTILFLGRLSERKGIPELLAALARPEMSPLPWRAILAGDGPVEAYRGLAAKLGLDDRLSMPGWLDEAETRELCATADILVLPSHAEGMALSVLEGLSHGLAVVTTRVGAHEEVLTDGVNGLFVPVGDVPALAHAMSSLVRDVALRRQLSRNARVLFQERFDVGGYLQRLYGHYRRIGTPVLEVVGAR